MADRRRKTTIDDSDIFRGGRRRTTIDDLDPFRGGYTPFQRLAQSELSRTPGAFDYSELDEKYPLQQVSPVVPSYIKREITEQELEDKYQQLRVLDYEKQLQIRDAELNQKLKTNEQIPLAREAMSKLNPADADYLEQQDKVMMEYPLAFDDSMFFRSVVSPRVRTHERLNPARRAEKDIPLEAYTQAVGLLEDKTLQDLASKGDRASQTQLRSAQQIMENFERQVGMPPVQVQPMSVPQTTSPSFSSVEEAEAAGLPIGTIVYINGRKARID